MIGQAIIFSLALVGLGYVGRLILCYINKKDSFTSHVTYELAITIALIIVTISAVIFME